MDHNYREGWDPPWIDACAVVRVVCVDCGRCACALITSVQHCVIDSISFSDSSVVMATSKNNIKNAAQPTTAIMMTSPTGGPLDDKDDVIGAKLDSYADDLDG